jgi:hypothetical protein
MDDTVLAALAKWPDVPAVYGWLGLSARGEWRLQGQPIRNVALREFIGRNYAADERGCWYFQNGPQRVFVELETAPWIWRINSHGAHRRAMAHTGVTARLLRGAWFDENGRVYLHTDVGFGLVESQDSATIVESLRAGSGRPMEDNELEAWLAHSTAHAVVHGAILGLDGNPELGRLRMDELPRRFGFVRAPRPD